MSKRKHWILEIGALLFVLYLGAYLVLSGRGYAESRRYDMCGFYYLPPENSDRWRFLNYGCMYLFHPLNTVDNWLGTGMAPAKEPLWGFSKHLARGGNRHGVL
jgi:hypothetical protein